MNNKITTYLLYAVGEIILVVVGILIAVQIDGWYQEKEQRKKERDYLIEIKKSLDEDVTNIDEILAYNTSKLAHIDTILMKMQNPNYEQMVYSLIPHFEVPTRYSIFNMDRISFDNMIASESISVIADNDLRKSLSTYYTASNDWQDRIILLSRRYIDFIFPKMMLPSLLKGGLGYDLPIKNDILTKANEDPEAINLILSLMKITEFQNERIKQKKEEAQELISKIELKIGTD